MFWLLWLGAAWRGTEKEGGVVGGKQAWFVEMREGIPGALMF